MKTAALGDLCEITVGRTPSRDELSYWGPGELWLSIADMNQGKIITRTKEQITPLAARSGRRVETGTVLLSFKLSIGKVGIAGVPLYTNEAIAALPIRHPDQLDGGYLMRALEWLDIAAGSNRAAMGATLNNATLRSIQIPVLPVDEQRRIAAILDQADAIRAKRRQVLTHLDALTQSIFYDMFGDPDACTSSVELGAVANLAGGRNLVADDSSASSEYRVLKISAVTTGDFKSEESKPLPPGYVPPVEHLVRAGDLLMSRANTTELVGAVAYVPTAPRNLALPDKIWRFEWTGEADPVFYHALMSTPAIRRQVSRLSSGTGGSMKNVSKAKLRAMRIPRVSIERQRAFSEQAAKVGMHRELRRHSIIASDELFASLQSRAFRGEL